MSNSRNSGRSPSRILGEHPTMCSHAFPAFAGFFGSTRNRVKATVPIISYGARSNDSLPARLVNTRTVLRSWYTGFGRKKTLNDLMTASPHPNVRYG